MKRRGFIALLGGPAALPLIALLRPLLAATPSWSANDKSPARSAGSKFRVRGIPPVNFRLSGRECALMAWSKVATTYSKSVTRMVTRPGCPVSRQS